jgi:hypothetical protein
MSIRQKFPKGKKNADVICIKQYTNTNKTFTFQLLNVYPAQIDMTWKNQMKGAFVHGKGVNNSYDEVKNHGGTPISSWFFPYDKTASDSTFPNFYEHFKVIECPDASQK